MSHPTRVRTRRWLAPATLACTFAALSCTETVGPDYPRDGEAWRPLPSPVFSVVPITPSGVSTTGVDVLTLPSFGTTMMAINESNWVVGQNSSEALLWRGGSSFEFLPRPTQNAADMAAFGLNDQGVIVGQWGGIGGVGIRWLDGGSPAFLPTPPNYFNGAVARAVDEDGNILVSYLRSSPCNDGPSSLRTAAVLRPPYTSVADYILLQGPDCENELQAHTIHDGVVMGFLSTRFSTVNTSGTFRWDIATGNPVTLIGDDWFPLALAGSYSSGLRNQIAVRSLNGALPEDLGTLGGATSRGNGVNSLGWVVGSSLTATGETHAFLWTPDDGMMDLGTVGGTFSTAAGINDQGYIVGDATNENGGRVGVIWIVPPASDDPPTIEPIPDQSATVGATLVVTPVVTDPEGDPFTLSWAGVPANATANGSLNFTPAADQVGNDYVVTVTATQDDDGALFASESFVISVLPAVIPSADVQVVVAPVTPQQQFVGDAVAYQASVHNAGPDAAAVDLTVELQYHEQTAWGAVPPAAAINGIFFLKLGVVESGQTVDVPFEVVYEAWGVQAVTATVAGNHDELQPDDNVATHDQVIDLAFSTAGVQAGGLDIPGEHITDGVGLAVVGVRIPGGLIAGHPDWDLFLPADLTPADLLPGGQLLQGAQFVAGGQFLPAVQTVSGQDAPDPVGTAPLKPAEFVPSPDAWLAGRVLIPAVNQWDPVGRLMFVRGRTNLRVHDRANTTLSVERGAGAGLAVKGAGGSTNADLHMCAGNFSARMGNADDAEFACGSLTTTVLGGQVMIVLTDGTRVDVPEGTTALIEEQEDGYDITAAGGAVTVTLAGGTFVISAGQTVFIGPPPAMVEALRQTIQHLVAGDDLSTDAASGLLDKLDAVADDLDKDKSDSTRRKVLALIREVESLVKDGRIGADHAQGLVDAANALLAAI